MICNFNKGSDIGTILENRNKFTQFFNPRIDDFKEHFEVKEGFFHAKTEIAEGTIKILDLNNINRLLERKDLIQFGIYT